MLDDINLKVFITQFLRVLFKQCRDMPTDEVYRHSNWNTLTFYYKLRLIKLLHSVFTGEAPAALSYLVNKACTAYNLRGVITVVLKGCRIKLFSPKEDQTENVF